MRPTAAARDDIGSPDLQRGIGGAVHDQHGEADDAAQQRKGMQQTEESLR